MNVDLKSCIFEEKPYRENLVIKISFSLRARNFKRFQEAKFDPGGQSSLQIKVAYLNKRLSRKKFVRISVKASKL